MTTPQARVMVFIDGSNLYHSLRNEFGRSDLDFERFCARLVGNRRLSRAYYYNAPIDQTKEPGRYREQQRFFDRMRRVSYLEVKLGRLVYRNWPAEPPYEKGIDIKLATDLLTHCFRDNYDVAVLVSGDTDFADALQAVKDCAKHIEVVLFGGPRTSRHLRDVADRVVDADEAFLADCWL